MIKIALVYALSYTGLLSPLYLAAFRAGGAIAVVPVTLGLNIVWGGVVLLLFLALRVALGGVPTMVAGAGQESAFTSRGGEIGAFVVAYLLIMISVLTFNGLFLSPLYASLGRGGQGQIAFAIGLAISLVNAVLVYLIFIGLRSAFCRPAGR
ncbi:MAG TPA: hypothetical protein VGR70_08580 [Stellaceae bacterium]|nr:hypothetical protein [Stellaceae bacterium]